jgi:hypothetical protein
MGPNQNIEISLTVIDEETPDSDRLEALKAMSESGEQVPCDFRVTGFNLQSEPGIMC